MVVKRWSPKYLDTWIGILYFSSFMMCGGIWPHEFNSIHRVTKVKLFLPLYFTLIISECKGCIQTPYVNFWPILIFSEIGSGWIPTILSDESELDFVVESQRALSNNQSYWIGGSAQTTGDIDFFHYFPYQTNSGEINFFC